MERGERRLTAAVLAACAGLFLALACPRLLLPAPTFQEGMHVLPALALLRGTTLGRDLWTSVPVRGHAVFLGFNEYTGSVETFPLLALFRLAGAGVRQWRFFALGVSLLAWLAFAWLAAEAFGRRAALATLALLVCQPALLAAARTGLENEFAVLCLTAGAAGAAYFRWQNTDRARWLALCVFALGLGSWEKMVLFQLSAAGLAAHALFSPRRAPREVFSFWLLGLSPLLVENVARPLWTARFVFDSLRHPWQGTGNGQFLGHVALRLRQAATVWAPDDLEGRWPRRALTALALGPLCAALWPAARRRLSGRWSGLALFAALFLVVSAVNGTGLRAYQLEPVLPFVVVLGAQALCALVEDRRRLAGVLAAAVVLQSAIFLRLMGSYEATGGWSAQSAALYDVLDYCRARGARRPVAVRGAVTENLEAASAGEIRPFDAARFGPGDWARWLSQPERLYLLPAPGQFGPRPLDQGRDFEGFVRSRGLELRPLRVFPNKAGVPIYIAAQAVPRARSAVRSRGVTAR